MVLGEGGYSMRETIKYLVGRGVPVESWGRLPRRRGVENVRRERVVRVLGRGVVEHSREEVRVPKSVGLNTF